MADKFQWLDLADKKTQKNFKERAFSIPAILGILVILIILPVTVLFLKTQQQTQQNAAVYGSNHDTCNLLTITFSESPSCPRLTKNTSTACNVISSSAKNNLTTYTFTAQIKSNDGKSHTFQFVTNSEFCNKGYASFGTFNGGPTCQCSDNAITKKGNGSITSTSVQTYQITRSSPNGTSCGSYQADLQLNNIDGKACNFLSNAIGASGLCETGTNCSAITPTPTKTPTPTPTPTLPPGITPTPTNTPSPTPTITPPVCQANQSVCKWQASANAVSYHYEVTDTTAGTTVSGDVQAPETSVSFSSVSGHSYSCTVTSANACGNGTSGTGTFTCAPTPTSCPVPSTPPNVRITCPNCANTQ